METYQICNFSVRIEHFESAYKVLLFSNMLSEGDHLPLLHTTYIIYFLRFLHDRTKTAFCIHTTSLSVTADACNMQYLSITYVETTHISLEIDLQRLREKIDRCV